MFSGPFSLILPRCEGGASLRHPAQAAARIAPYEVYGVFTKK